MRKNIYALATLSGIALALVHLLSIDITVDADALLKAMSAALDCETVCVSLLTSTRTIISNGTGLMQPGMSFPTGVCHCVRSPGRADHHCRGHAGR